MGDKLNKLIERLESIAKKNNDKFVYNIEINSTKKGLLFTFTCKDRSCDHVFVEGSKFGLPGCLDDAEKDIEGALSLWGYDE